MLSVFVRHSTADALPMVSGWLTVALQLWTGEWDGAIHIRDIFTATRLRACPSGVLLCLLLLHLHIVILSIHF